MKRFARVACVLVLAAAPPVRAEHRKSKPVTVPFELLQTKHMAVMVTINGKGPYRVIFDTGAPVTLLNTKVGKETGLLGKDTKAPMFSLFGPAAQVKIQTLEVGGLKAEGVAAIVMNHPTVDALSQALGPVEGIVGFPFFARYKMTLDYQAQEITFVPNGYDPPDALQALMATLMTMTQDKKPAPQVLSPAAQWGLVVHKDCADEEAGVTVKEVLPEGPAARAGLKPGDRLLTLDGRWTDTVADCYAAAGHVRPETAVRVTIRRNGRELELAVTPRSGL
jgi:membrane-associated protease RseP (regulator of RpoE activity)